MDYQKAITALEDYGYSYKFSQRILDKAYKDGIWTSATGMLVVAYIDKTYQMHHRCDNGCSPATCPAKRADNATGTPTERRER